VRCVGPRHREVVSGLAEEYNACATDDYGSWDGGGSGFGLAAEAEEDEEEMGALGRGGAGGPGGASAGAAAGGRR
jgi:hypothetical protein